jgi:hypothetical protein
MELKYILKIFIFMFLILSLIVFINTTGLNLNEQTPKKLLSVYTMEGLTNADSSIIMNKSDAFCESYRGSSGALDDACGKLTKTNCNTTSCCVWTSDDKCVAGGANGPTFNSDAKGKTKQLDYYYFQNKCYGPKCP